MKYESVWHVCLPACMCVCVGVPRQTAWDLCLFPFSTPLATESSRSEYVHTELLAHHCSVRVCVCVLCRLCLTQKFMPNSLSIAVTVNPSNVIAIRGVDGHDFTKFCLVTDIRLDLQTNNIRLSECI